MIVLVVFPCACWLFFSVIVKIKWQLAFRRPAPRLTVKEKRVKSMKRITFFFRKGDAKHRPMDQTSSWFGFLWFLCFMFWVVLQWPFCIKICPHFMSKGATVALQQQILDPSLLSFVGRQELVLQWRTYRTQLTDNGATLVPVKKLALNRQVK